MLHSKIESPADDRLEMCVGLFGKRDKKEFIPIETMLDEAWFISWARQIAEARSESLDLDALTELWTKATAVIDHDCAHYVIRDCDSRAASKYKDYVNSDEVTPWGLAAMPFS